MALNLLLSNYVFYHDGKKMDNLTNVLNIYINVCI
jgi:hypothetical protein